MTSRNVKFDEDRRFFAERRSLGGEKLEIDDQENFRLIERVPEHVNEVASERTTIPILEPEEAEVIEALGDGSDSNSDNTRPNRNRRPPDWFGVEAYTSSVERVLSDSVPKNDEEALNTPTWYQAMREEYDSLVENKV